MAIDVATALAAAPQISTISWTQTDVLLYHLSLGAGSRPGAPELPLTFEAGLSVLPTFGLVAGQGPSSAAPAAGQADSADAAGPSDTAESQESQSSSSEPPRMRLPGIDVDLRAVLHAGQSLRAHRRLPTSGTAQTRRRVCAVYDLGKAALIVIETSAVDADGPLWTEHSQIYVRSEGGFGGEPAPPREPIPQRDPDVCARVTVCPQQALLYRLNGDFNPLHIDPEFARSAGLPGPILHGLASYGIAAKALTDALAGGRPDALAEVGARFSGMVTPGDTLVLEAWETGDRNGAFRALVEGSGQTVLDEGVFSLR